MSEFMADSSNSFDDKRLAELIAAKCNGVITEPEHIELESLLSQSSHARVEYWDAISFHIDLEWELEGKEACEEVLAQVLTEDHIAMGEDRPQKKSLARSIGWISVLAASLFVALLGGLIYWQSDRDDSQLQLAAVETVIGEMKPLVEGSRWSSGEPGNTNPIHLVQGDTLRIVKGAAKLRLRSDVVAELESPSVVQLVDLKRIRVIQGRIKVDVPEGREGFTVETTEAEVIDLGTSFSVEATTDGTDVVVFQGAVDLKVAEQYAVGAQEPASPLKRFTAGEAVRVGVDGTLSRIVNVNQAEFPSHGSQDLPEPVIKAVRDNIVRDDMWSFYEIVPSGMEEDAKAFVDRTHEWNGITFDGIPSYLLGADYVKTFCDDKVTPDLSIELELLGPATVYVFLDDRLTLPEWVLEQFQDTDDEIGVDESFPERGHDPKVGPGKGIERKFSVWKRVSEPGIVYLGPNGNPSTQEIIRGIDAPLAMYGIAVVPLDEVD
jgi:hypothetical protein